MTSVIYLETMKEWDLELLCILSTIYRHVPIVYCVIFISKKNNVVYYFYLRSFPSIALRIPTAHNLVILVNFSM